MSDVITDEIINKVAKLAKLSIKEEDFGLVKQRLSSVFDMLSCLEEIDLSSVEPMYSACDSYISLREDMVENTDKEIFEYADRTKKERYKEISYYTVNKIIE